MRAIGFILGLSAAVSASAQDARNITIMGDFVPERSRLEPIRGDVLEGLFEDLTVKGIYYQSRPNGQRYVETTGGDGSVVYTEGLTQTTTGRWKRIGNTICFYYAEDPSFGHCHYQFRYGDCIINYPRGTRLNLKGTPLRAQDWGAVSVAVEPDFAWPDVPASEVQPLTCRLMMS